MMNNRFALLALSMTIAVVSLTLFIAVVGGTTSNASGVAIGIEADTVMKSSTDYRLLAYRRPNISQDEPLSLTEPISIYLPLQENEYIKNYAERAALMALYNNTNGNDWIYNYRWGTDLPFCEWYGVTCDEGEHVAILDLGGNKLSGILPAEIGDLPMLTQLRITPTEVDCGKGGCTLIQIGGPIPPEVGNLANLQVLDLGGNQHTSLPAEIGNLVSLQELNLWGNPLMTLPPEIGNLVNLQVLNVSGNQLTSLPPEIGNLASLEELNLWVNPLAAIPAEIGNLTSLERLYLGGTQLTSIPPEIGNLMKLQELHLEENQLTSLPPEIGNLVNLESLELDSNLLTSLPPSIGNLVNLQVLGLGNLQLLSLPPEIGNLVSLNQLYLGGNQLTSLPEGIGNFVKLVVLNLSNNRISGPIPEFLSNLDNLSYLYLDGNPDLTCWETQEARDWALSIYDYSGPICFFPMNIYLPGCYRN